MVIGAGLMNSQAIRSKLTGPARLVDIEKAVVQVLETYKPNLICLEGYGFMSYSGNAQAELGGVIRRRLYLDGYSYIEVAPSQVKKFATGKGNMKKEFMPLEVHKRWGVQFRSHDETDAYVLARLAEAILLVQISQENLSKYTQFQQEVLRQLLGIKIEKAPKKLKGQGLQPGFSEEVGGLF